MAASRAALSTPWSQRDLREKIHRHVIMDTSHQFPMRLIGDMKPRCKIKSLSAAELQLVVQMPGEMHWIGSWGQSQGLGSHTDPANAQVPWIFLLSIYGLLWTTQLWKCHPAAVCSQWFKKGHFASTILHTQHSGEAGKLTPNWASYKLQPYI